MSHTPIHDNIDQIVATAIEIDKLARGATITLVGTDGASREYDAFPELIRDAVGYANQDYSNAIRMLMDFVDGSPQGLWALEGWRHAVVVSAFATIQARFGVAGTIECAVIPDMGYHSIMVQRTWLDAVANHLRTVGHFEVLFPHAFSREDQASWEPGCFFDQIYTKVWGSKLLPGIWLDPIETRRREVAKLTALELAGFHATRTPSDPVQRHLTSFDDVLVVLAKFGFGQQFLDLERDMSPAPIPESELVIS